MQLRGLFLSRGLFIFFLSFFVYFFSWFFVYETGINDTAIQSEDTLPALFVPASISLEGNLNLDEYFELLVSKYPQPDGGRVPFYLEEIDGHFYSAFPVVTGLLAAPVYFFPLQLSLPITFETVSILGHLSASLMIALSVMFMYLTFSKLLEPAPPKEKPVPINRDGWGIGRCFPASVCNLMKELLSDRAVILSFVYAFGTCSFALTSQALWQHTASQLMLTLALYFLVLGLESPKKMVWSGLFLSLATLARPTGGIAVIVLSMYIFLRFLLFRYSEVSAPAEAEESPAVTRLPFSVRGFFAALRSAQNDRNIRWWLNFLCYILLGLLPLVLFLLIPSLHWGVFAGYSSQVSAHWTAPFPLGFLGEWFSPSKGTLVYSPVFIFSFVGVCLLLRGEVGIDDLNNPAKSSNEKAQMTNEIQSSKSRSFGICNFGFGISQRLANMVSRENIFYWVFACILIHTLVVGKWYHWYGGWAFGYRMMSDMMPFLAFLWVPFARSEYWDKLKHWFYLAAVWSVGIQLAGIAFFDGVWHNLFDKGPDNQAWLWSIKNSEMLYYLRRLIAKLQGKPTNLVR